MGAIRRRLSWLLCGWLLCQGVAIAAPALSALGGLAASVEELCTCPGAEPGAVCPMHHEPAASSSPAMCAFTSPHDASDATLLSLAGGPGILQSAEANKADRPAAFVIEPAPPSVQTRTQLPDAPPPRA